MSTTTEISFPPQPLETAPRKHEIVWVLVDYSDDGFGELVDSAEPGWTLGMNGFDHTGVDEWILVGWDWTHDVFTEGKGKVIGWHPTAPVWPIQDGPFLCRPEVAIRYARIAHALAFALDEDTIMANEACELFQRVMREDMTIEEFEAELEEEETIP